MRVKLLHLLLLFFIGVITAQAQEREQQHREDQQPPRVAVKGKVFDDAGQPVAGASVMVKGSRTAVTAGADGSFTIDAPLKSVLVISYVGFADKEVTVTGK